MKQHITVEQFMELKDSAKVKLWEWAQAEGRHYLVASEDKQTIYPLLSIGQMIEFLNEHGHKDMVIKRINGDWDYEHDRYHYFHPYGQELAEALWDAVKNVLEKDDVTTC